MNIGALSLQDINVAGKLRLRPASKSPLRRELVQLTLPILVETLLVMTLGAVDTFMLSRHSDISVASVGLANQVLTFCFLVFEVINLGTSVLCSQYLGHACGSVWRPLSVCLLLSILCSGWR